MTSDRIDALAGLLAEAEAAHSVYEATELNGVYDEDWPRWYAGYVVDHGIGAVMGRAFNADELAQFLSRAWDDFQAIEPTPAEPWGPHTARRIAEEL